MSRSWSSIVSSPKAKVVFHSFCADCGAEADACESCDTNAIYEDGLCGSCYVRSIPSDSMCKGYMDASRNAEKIPFKCASCRQSNPWRWEDEKEIVGYSYEPMCFCHPLSPTNVIRIATYRTIGLKPTDFKKRHAEAQAASDKEMAFSGSYGEALQVYHSFFKGQPPTMEQILAGRRVSGKQFFEALASEQ
jgi:hypothetical protein